MRVGVGVGVGVRRVRGGRETPVFVHAERPSRSGVWGRSLGTTAEKSGRVLSVRCGRTAGVRVLVQPTETSRVTRARAGRETLGRRTMSGGGNVPCTADRRRSLGARLGRERDQSMVLFVNSGVFRSTHGMAPGLTAMGEREGGKEGKINNRSTVIVYVLFKLHPPT